MPGPVSDSYDPEFGTSSEATTVREAVKKVLGRVTDMIGSDTRLPIVGVAEQALADGFAEAKTVLFSPAELRVIRFCLDRTIEDI